MYKKTKSNHLMEMPRYGWLPKLKYVQVATHSRCNADCVFPLSGDTKVITPDGEVPIADLVGECTLLVPALNNGGAGGSGIWQSAIVRSFGVQELRTVTLRRGRTVKQIRATPEHRWVIKKYNRESGAPKQRMFVPTSELQVGDVIPSCNMASYKVSSTPIALSRVGVAQGFTFGDGSCEQADKRNSPTSTRLYAEKDVALLDYFQGCRVQHVVANGKTVPQVCDLPRYWKQLPPIEECKSFLLGWLAGYFAADGTISKSGSQAVINSSKIEHLEFVKNVCVRLGIGTNPITDKVRVGFGKESSLYGISIRVSDLSEEFFICNEHRNRFNSRVKETTALSWKVESVVDHGELAPVYCATVPGVECFAMADNILTGNCPYIESSHAAQYGMMTDETWKLILLNLVPWKDTLTKICPYLMQEPLIDKTIFQKIADIYELFPDICVEVSTNGAALTDAAVDKLFKLFDGRRHDIWVSHHGIDADTLQHIMKIDYAKASANLLNMLKKADGRFTIKIRGAGESKAVDKVYFTGAQYKAYWAKIFADNHINTKSVSVDSFQFHDRAGTLFREDRGACNLNKGKVRDIGPNHAPFACNRVTEWMHIMHDGDIRLCCMDYHHEIKLPNIHSMSLLEYFHSPEYRDIVMKVSGRTESDENFICKRCTSPGG